VVSANTAFTTIGFAGFILTIAWVGAASIALGLRPRGQGVTVQGALTEA
jgi:hypothetical protein